MMMRQTQLDVTWDGPIPSLVEHRISLALFSQALTNLLLATRRIASNMVSNAMEQAATGRFAKEAHQIDVELGDVLKNSSGFSAMLTFNSPDPQQPLFNQLTEAVGIELLESIEQEAKGHLKSLAVRRYLEVLPKSLAHQKYYLHENGRTIKTITIGKMNLPRVQFDLPELMVITGRVIGVNFYPAPDEVRLRAEEGDITVSATQEQVQQALVFRESTVRAVIIRDIRGQRLLVLEDATLPSYRPDPQYFLFKKWEKALGDLAR